MKKSKATKHPCIIHRGTLFRIVATIVHPTCKEAYLKIGDRHNRGRMDSRLAHNASFVQMLATYHFKNYECLQNLGDQSVIGLDFYYQDGVTVTEPSDFDELTVDEFRNCVNHINFKYDKAMQNNKKSGNHGDFHQYVDRNSWLWLYHFLLKEVITTITMICIVFVQHEMILEPLAS